ncbi:hypothetical protein [Calothrix sp. NIES-3974]|uniref:hypothetical protein n=1 Tax=Calothrix sp. NIES-3974 TaxID=2005462 RepID=UPI001560F191|nr:hypothetical protein [Calothrix sp. NIES-3974]
MKKGNNCNVNLSIGKYKQTEISSLPFPLTREDLSGMLQIHVSKIKNIGEIQIKKG